MAVQRGGSRIKIFGKSKGDIGPKSKAYEKPANKGFRDVFKLRFIDKADKKFWKKSKLPAQHKPKDYTRVSAAGVHCTP